MKVIIVTGLFCFFIIKIKFLKDNSIFKTQELVLMNNDKRDNFTNAVKNKLAKRVMYVCSNPNCRKMTIGPDSKNGINNIGVAAHICAAAPGGPRYDINMSEEELCAEANKWELSHGGISGRTAQQFINHCLGNCR